MIEDRRKFKRLVKKRNIDLVTVIISFWFMTFHFTCTISHQLNSHHIMLRYIMSEEDIRALCEAKRGRSEEIERGIEAVKRE